MEFSRNVTPQTFISRFKILITAHSPAQTEQQKESARPHGQRPLRVALGLGLPAGLPAPVPHRRSWGSQLCSRGALSCQVRGGSPLPTPLQGLPPEGEQVPDCGDRRAPPGGLQGAVWGPGGRRQRGQAPGRQSLLGGHHPRPPGRRPRPRARSRQGHRAWPGGPRGTGEVPQRWGGAGLPLSSASTLVHTRSHV